MREGGLLLTARFDVSQAIIWVGTPLQGCFPLRCQNDTLYQPTSRAPACGTRRFIIIHNPHVIPAASPAENGLPRDEDLPGIVQGDKGFNVIPREGPQGLTRDIIPAASPAENGLPRDEDVTGIREDDNTNGRVFFRHYSTAHRAAPSFSCPWRRTLSNRFRFHSC